MAGRGQKERGDSGVCLRLNSLKIKGCKLRRTQPFAGNLTPQKDRFGTQVACAPSSSVRPAARAQPLPPPAEPPPPPRQAPSGRTRSRALNRQRVYPCPHAAQNARLCRPSTRPGPRRARRCDQIGRRHVLFLPRCARR
eukprot:3492103-Pleurochrysis_carterae.AAC.2